MATLVPAFDCLRAAQMQTAHFVFRKLQTYTWITSLVDSSRCVRTSR